jgi:hypothetical protein
MTEFLFLFGCVFFIAQKKTHLRSRHLPRCLRCWVRSDVALALDV